MNVSLRTTLRTSILVMGFASFIQAKDEFVYVDLSRVSQETTEFKSWQESIESDVQTRVKEIEKISKDFQEKAQKLQASARDLKGSALEKLQEEVANLQNKIEIKKRNLQAYVQKISGDVEEKLIKKIREICANLGYGGVLPNAVYASVEYDKTSEIITALNKSYTATHSASKPKVA